MPRKRPDNLDAGIAKAAETFEAKMHDHATTKRQNKRIAKEQAADPGDVLFEHDGDSVVVLHRTPAADDRSFRVRFVRVRPGLIQIVVPRKRTAAYHACLSVDHITITTTDGRLLFDSRTDPRFPTTGAVTVHRMAATK